MDNLLILKGETNYILTTSVSSARVPVMLNLEQTKHVHAQDITKTDGEQLRLERRENWSESISRVIEFSSVKGSTFDSLIAWLMV